MSINAKVSELIDMPIRSGRWMSYCDALNDEGRPDRRTLNKIVFTICAELEINEALIARLQQKVEELEGESEPMTFENAPKTPAIEEVATVIPEDHPEAVQINTEPTNQPTNVINVDAFTKEREEAKRIKREQFLERMKKGREAKKNALSS